MPIVQIEHPIHDFEAWKAAFDRDPVHREASGVRSYRIFRPVDDPNYVAVDLVLDTRPQAEAFKLALEEMWRSPQAAATLGGTPRARIVDIAETRLLSGPETAGHSGPPIPRPSSRFARSLPVPPDASS